MALPKGTTARQLGSLARWMLTCLVVIAMMAWPRPSMTGWGALLTGMVATLVLWLMWRAVEGGRTVPGHPFQWVLLVPAAILAYHLCRQSLPADADSTSNLAGAMNVSMLLQLGLLAAAVMLSQSLLPRAAQHAGVLSICGAAMMLAPLAAKITDGAAVEAMRGSLALLGFAGVGVWLSSLWGVGWRAELWPDDWRAGRAGNRRLGGPRVLATRGKSGMGVSPMRRMAKPLGPPAGMAMPRKNDFYHGLLGTPNGDMPMQAKALLAGIVAVAIVAAAGLTWLSPESAILSACMFGGVLLLSGLVFAQHRLVFLIAGGAVTAGALAAGVAGRVGHLTAQLGQVGLLGLGEAAFGRIDASDNGLTVLAWTIGWGGLCWMAGGLLVCVVWLMRHAPGRGPKDRSQRTYDRQRAVVWTWATAVSSCAMLSVGGLFTPAMVVAVGLTWGLMPQMLGRPGRARSGGILLVVMVALAVVIGVARQRGLVSWAAESVLNSPHVDKWMHVGMGFILAMTLAWLMGARHSWLGLVGIAVAAAAGWLGELTQLAFQRPMDPQDSLAHLYGCVAAVGPYLLCVGARWCESADVRPVSHRATDAYL